MNAFFAIPGWLITGISLFTIAAYFHFRSGSSYGLVNRLYSLLIGGSDFSNDKLKRFWQERTDIERFNALFYMKAKSMKEIYWFQDRVKKNELDVKFFSKMRGGYDAELRKVKKFSPWILAIPFIVLIFVTSAIQPLFFVATSDGAIIKMKNEDQWISLNQNGASSVRFVIVTQKGTEWAFNKAACSKKLGQSILIKKTGLSGQSISKICEYLEDPDSSSYINQVISDQKLFWYLGFLYILVAMLVGKEILGLVHTLRARPKLYAAFIKARKKRMHAA